MIIHIVLFKLKTHPSLESATPPATFTDATATNVIEATHGEINDHQEKIKKEIAAALKKVPGPLTMEVGPPLLPDRAKGYNFGLYSRFKDTAALQAYAVSDEHMDAVNNLIKPNVEDALAYDFEVPDE